MPERGGARTLRVEVIYALPDRSWRRQVQLAAGATVMQAIEASDIAARVGIDIDPGCLAVFGHTVQPTTVLHDGDRVEILRPLLCDPKEVRRRRARDAR